MIFPACATNVSPGVVALVVGLTTGNCYWEGTCKPSVGSNPGCTNTTPIVAAAPDEFTTLTVAEASRGLPVKSGSISDRVGSQEFWCDGNLSSVSLGTGSWLIGTRNCTVGRLEVTGTGAHVEGIDVQSYGPLVGVGLELKDLSGATAVIAPPPGGFSVRCTGLSIINSRAAVGGCKDDWSASGDDAVIMYQASTAPTGSPGTLISIDAITNVFGRPYEARFYEGVTDVDAKREIFFTSLVFAGTSVVILLGSLWLT